jgi:hypothetical protein
VQEILKHVDQYNAVIWPVIAERSPSAARYHDSEVENLKERITARDESLSRQIANLANRPKTDSSGILHISGWGHRTQTGSSTFRQEKTADGQDALYLGANGNSIGSWRTKITLEEGAYRFEGKVKVLDVRPSSGEPTSGAGLRISGGAVAKEFNGTQDWQKFGYTFHVQESGHEIELICELRASKGEAWFDTSSLRVTRLR